jgi:hypothetical protein
MNHSQSNVTPRDPKALRRWLAFLLTPQADGSVDKRPTNVLSGGFAKSDDADTWASHEDARAYCSTNENCVLGFALGEEVGLVVVDIDKARKSKDEPWPEWVEREVSQLDSFTEDSCSGLGRHVWLWGRIPSNLNRQKYHAELHGSKKMFVVSEAFAEGWQRIRVADAGELEALHQRIAAGHIGPEYKAPIRPFAYDSEKFKRACAGDTVDYDYDNSRAVQGVLWTLAKKHNYDETAIREAFEATALCGIWEAKGGKWTRLAESEIHRAIDEVKKREPVSEVPAGIDLEAPLPDQEVIPPFPRQVMYGRAGELAQSLDCPMGYAYLAVLAAASGRFRIGTNGTRGTLNAALLGTIGDGKSVTQDRAASLFGLDWEERKTPASDKGLQRLFPATIKEKGEDGTDKIIAISARPALLLVDELRELMAKASIENSTLALMLCTLFYRDRAGSIAKDGPAADACVRLSILGAMKVAHPSEFPQVFGFATAQGLYDRFLFAVRDVSDGWYYREYTTHLVNIAPSDPVIAPECDIALRDWKAGKPERQRLGELAKRVALVSAALNGDATLTPSSPAFTASLVYAEYQEAIRSVYRPAQGANEHQECVEAVMEAFKQAGGAANWRKLSQRYHWHRRFPKVLGQVKRLLESNGDLGFDEKSGKHFLARAE